MNEQVLIDKNTTFEDLLKLGVPTNLDPNLFENNGEGVWFGGLPKDKDENTCVFAIINNIVVNEKGKQIHLTFTVPPTDKKEEIGFLTVGMEGVVTPLINIGDAWDSSNNTEINIKDQIQKVQNFFIKEKIVVDLIDGFNL